MEQTDAGGMAECPGGEYSQTSEQRTFWEQYKFKSFVLGCPLLGGSRTIGKPIIWDLEKRPL